MWLVRNLSLIQLAASQQLPCCNQQRRTVSGYLCHAQSACILQQGMDWPTCYTSDAYFYWDYCECELNCHEREIQPRSNVLNIEPTTMASLSQWQPPTAQPTVQSMVQIPDHNFNQCGTQAYLFPFNARYTEFNDWGCLNDCEQCPAYIYRSNGGDSGRFNGGGMGPTGPVGPVNSMPRSAAAMDNIDPYIYNGRDVDVRSVPWQVNIIYNQQIICGGAIISSSVSLNTVSFNFPIIKNSRKS